MFSSHLKDKVDDGAVVSCGALGCDVVNLLLQGRSLIVTWQPDKTHDTKDRKLSKQEESAGLR
jgi:hypothetical protein